MSKMLAGMVGGGGVLSQGCSLSQSLNGCLSKEGGVSPERTSSLGQIRDESGVRTSSQTTSSPSTNPSSNFVSAKVRPEAWSLALAFAKRSRHIVCALLSNSAPTREAAVSKSMLMSCPDSALVEGVNIGVGNASVRAIAFGAAML